MSLSTVYHTKNDILGHLKRGEGPEVLEARATGCDEAAARVTGVEFDDSRSRHKFRTEAKLLRKAATAMREGGLTEDEVLGW